MNLRNIKSNAFQKYLKIVNSDHLNNISPDDDLSQLSESKVKQNTTTQVCWFRYCTLSFEDHLNMSQVYSQAIVYDSFSIF